MFLDDSSSSFLQRSRVAACVGVLALVLASAPAQASAGTPNAAAKAGLGFSSFVVSLLYAPVKIVYAAGGLVVGSFAYVFTAGDLDTARTVWVPSTLGDYVITPDMLTGETTPEFIGRDPRYSQPGALAKADAPAPSSDTWDTPDSPAPTGW